ncbi:hypothetical protein IV500_04240 [Paeniglutamicibacter antarcticus]|uniref:Uncharacterized protein n=1 Tax=Arthrobacter terrae TaxID=2935737 RepID=A0A931CLF1_9MICC|nr:hypothetical protein [Arthrobacter terrae]MBG0738630.1 hypothetical protein [Arthrobacter terrae]
MEASKLRNTIVTVSTIGYTSTILSDDGESGAASFLFPRPRSSRTCPDEGTGVVTPSVHFQADGTEARTIWIDGSPNELPEEINTVIAGLANQATALEHRQAEAYKILPVPESVAERFRTIDPAATVEDIRAAEAASAGLSALDTNLSTDQIALWITRHFVSRETYNDKAAELESVFGELEEMTDAGCECGPAITDQEKATLDAVNDLRFRREWALEFRPGRTTMEKVVDLFETAAA